MKTAWCLIREGPHYRRNAFLEGLRKTGYTVSTSSPPDGGKRTGDVLVIWNRYGDYHMHAERFEKAGGRVIVAENGYAGRDAEGRQYYALSAAWHQRPLIESRITNHESRFSKLGIAVKPWRADGKHILICPQRGFGVRPHCMEKRWPGQTANALRQYTKRPVRIRPHPEDRDVPVQDRTRRPLDEDLADCWAVVVWSSTAGVKALIAGIPVFRCGPNFIAEAAAKHGIAEIEGPLLGDRGAAFERLAWGQWSIAEIDAGLPFSLMRREPTENPEPVLA